MKQYTLNPEYSLKPEAHGLIIHIRNPYNNMLIVMDTNVIKPEHLCNFFNLNIGFENYINVDIIGTENKPEIDLKKYTGINQLPDEFKTKTENKKYNKRK